MDYAAIFSLPLQQRLRLFNTLTADEKAELLRTRIRSWTESRRRELSAEQIAILDEHLERVRPELYRYRGERDDPYRRDLIARTAKALGFDRMAQVFTLTNCDCPDFREVIELRGVPNTSQVVVELHMSSRFSDDIDAIVRLPNVTHRVHMTTDKSRKGPPNPAMARVSGLFPTEGPETVDVIIQSDPPGVPLWGGADVIDTRTNQSMRIHPFGYTPPSRE